MTYMVMECYLSYAVVLSEDGRVLKVANMNYTVGDIVENVFPMNEKQPPSYLQTKVIAPILVLAALFIIMLNTTPIFNSNFATIIIDINPKIALVVNKDNTVKKVTARNNDAKDLLNGYEHQNKSVERVTEELIARAMDQGYLTFGGSISLIFDSNDQNWVLENTESMKNKLAQPLSDKLNISISISNAKTHKTDIITPNTKTPPSNRPGKNPEDDTDYSDYEDRDPLNPSDDYDDDSDYDQDRDDSDYDETDYDDTDYHDTDYDDSDYDDTDFEDADD